MISTVSAITAQDIAEYIRLAEPTEEDTAFIEAALNVAKRFIESYTGQTDLDEHEDFVIVALVLCQDMYDNRTLYVDKSTMNRVVETILGMHSVNLL